MWTAPLAQPWTDAHGDTRPDLRRAAASRNRATRMGSLIGRGLLAATEWWRGSRVLSLYRELALNPFRAPEICRADQWDRLAALLAHAEAHVPYYRDVFRSMRISARDVRSWSDFAALPILTKDIVRDRARDLLSVGPFGSGLIRHSSGGSTGVPLSFFHDRRSEDAAEAGTLRNLAQSDWRPGEMIAFFWGFDATLARMPRWEFEARQFLRRQYQFDPFHSGAEDLDRWLKRWRTLRPRVALGYASTMARFAEHIEARGARVPPLRGVFSTAEPLFPEQRAVLGRVFGCPVFDLYGSSEVRNIAAECPHGRMHVNIDFAVVETETALTPGEDGPRPLLVTSLWNYGMPFIRYRNEDAGRLADGTCTCGNSFPLMHLDVGRLSDQFVLPGGLVVHGGFFRRLLWGAAGVQTFQVHQTALDDITFRIVPGPAWSEAREQVLAQVRASIAALTGAPIRVRIEEVPSIPLSGAGKHRYARSDVPLPTPSEAVARR
jgi:phenylacetate-CoA ligase